MDDILNSENTIFKYVSFNSNSLKIIINGELWFGKPKNQNDPFEAEFVIEGFSEKLNEESRLKIIKQMSSNDNINYLKDKYDNDPEDRKFILDYSDYIKNQIKDKFGICCFSNTYKEILLWTHYANSHKGMCLMFDKKKLSTSLKNEDSEIEGNNTIPSENVPRIKINIHKSGYPFINAYDTLLFKYKNFEYENEFRYVKYFPPIFNKERSLKFEKSALVGVILGESMSMDDCRTIINLLKSIPEYGNIPIYTSLKNLVDLSIRPLLITPQHPSYYELFKDQGATQRLPFIPFR